MQVTGSTVTPNVLVEMLGLSAGPAVWGYRDAVVSAARDLGVPALVNHNVGPVQIGLSLPAVPALLIGWRVDYGWYFVRRHRRGDPPAIGPTRCRPAADPFDRMVPEPAAVAHWLRDISRGKWVGTDPVPVTASPECVRAAVERLRGYQPPIDAPLYSWSDDRPLSRPAWSVSRSASSAV